MHLCEYCYCYVYGVISIALCHVNGLCVCVCVIIKTQRGGRIGPPTEGPPTSVGGPILYLVVFMYIPVNVLFILFIFGIEFMSLYLIQCE